MKLTKMAGSNLFLEYKSQLKLFIKNRKKLLTEDHVTINIPNAVFNFKNERVVKPQEQIKPVQENEIELKKKLIEHAIKIGNFKDHNWMNQLLNGMKQAGIHGIDGIKSDNRPATLNEMKEILGLIIEMIIKGK